MADKHFIGEINTQIIVDVGQDVANSSVHSLRVKKPNNTVVTWNAEVYAISGVSRYLRYFTTQNDLDVTGLYELQSYIKIGSWEGFGDTAQFMVYSLFS